MIGGEAFAKTICSICYEDLKPIVEDLQAISLCGHVFHELCLQQWFEYCSDKKRNTCPVCKQTCTNKNLCRLYFQSVGDPNDPLLSQKQIKSEINSEALRKDLKQLEGKVSALNSILDHQQKDLKELNHELGLSKEQVKREATMKLEALKQKACIQQLLHTKSMELNESNLECSRLQERNISLAKELAALKLVADVNLEEEEVLKLASLGNESNSKDTVEILRKSLVIRNKSYKELMAKCNLLGRGEARSLKKLEKAKEKINILKARVQELERDNEERDNEVLRTLKASKQTTCKSEVVSGANCKSNQPFMNKYSSKDRFEQLDVPSTNADCTGRSKPNNVFSVNNANADIDSHFLVDEDVSKNSCKLKNRAQVPSKEAVSISNGDNPVNGHNTIGLFCSKTGSRNQAGNAPRVNTEDEDLTLVVDEITQVQPLPHIRKQTPFLGRSSITGDHCFSGGLLGPDGTKRYLGKWCKRVQPDGSIASSMAMQGSSTTANDLIAVGADGRGGKIKVLRSLNQSPLDGATKHKYGAKTSALQSQGCLQIEHFFGKTGH